MKENNIDDDIISGYVFRATLGIKIPLKILQRDGEIFKGKLNEAPKYGNRAQGIWNIKTKSFRELGLDVDDFPETDSASDIGPIKRSVYLPFLIQFRSIADSRSSVSEKLVKLNVLKDSRAVFSDVWDRLENRYKGFPLSFL